jgi:hypothetical protein
MSWSAHLPTFPAHRRCNNCFRALRVSLSAPYLEVDLQGVNARGVAGDASVMSRLIREGAVDKLFGFRRDVQSGTASWRFPSNSPICIPVTQLTPQT